MPSIDLRSSTTTTKYIPRVSQQSSSSPTCLGLCWIQRKWFSQFRVILRLVEPKLQVHLLHNWNPSNPSLLLIEFSIRMHLMSWSITNACMALSRGPLMTWTMHLASLLGSAIATVARAIVSWDKIIILFLALRVRCLCLSHRTREGQSLGVWVIFAVKTRKLSSSSATVIFLLITLEISFAMWRRRESSPRAFWLSTLAIKSFQSGMTSMTSDRVLLKVVLKQSGWEIKRRPSKPL